MSMRKAWRQLAAFAALLSQASALSMRSDRMSTEARAERPDDSEAPVEDHAASWGAEHVVMALAAYRRDVSEFPLAFVNTLRATGFRGAVFLGVWEGTPDSRRYLQINKVTPKYIREAPCQMRYEEQKNNNPIRSVCTADFPHLRLESSRFLYGRRWLLECSTCTGWAMYADFGDIVFQQDPFKLLPDWRDVAPETVYLTEEMLPHTDFYNRSRGVSCDHWMVKNAIRSCYGEVPAQNISGGKPMLNVGSTIGTIKGMINLLGRMEEEFENNSYNAKCDPTFLPDQGLFNHMFYNEGRLPFATPKPYGSWIVNTMGMACANQPGLKPDHSMKDHAIIDGSGLVWNEDGTLPALLHQGKVCHLNYNVRETQRFNGVREPSIFSDELKAMVDHATFPGMSGMATASPPEEASPPVDPKNGSK